VQEIKTAIILLGGYFTLQLILSCYKQW